MRLGSPPGRYADSNALIVMIGGERQRGSQLIHQRNVIAKADKVRRVDAVFLRCTGLSDPQASKAFSIAVFQLSSNEACICAVSEVTRAANFGGTGHFCYSFDDLNQVMTSTAAPNQSATLNARRASGSSQRYRFVRELSDDLRQIWLSFIRTSNHLDHPFLHPAFFETVSAIRDDTCIIVIENDAGQIVGLLPLQVNQRRVATPIGGRLSDLQAMIGPPEIQIDWPTLFDSLNLAKFRFHALREDSASTNLPHGAIFDRTWSPTINLSTGFERYFASIGQSHATIKRHAQKSRKMAKELGPIRFEFDCRDPSVFTAVIESKRNKYRQTHTFDLFRVAWARDLVERIFATHDREFGGCLSVVWAGDRLIAGHMGIRSGSILHYWFPVFDSRFARYSPGIELLIAMIRSSPQHGIDTIDLGYGDQAFKSHFATSGYFTTCGSVANGRRSMAVDRQAYRLKSWVKSLPFHNTTKLLIRSLYPSFGRGMYR